MNQHRYSKQDRLHQISLAVAVRDRKVEFDEAAEFLTNLLELNSTATGKRALQAALDIVTGKTISGTSQELRDSWDAIRGALGE